MPFSVKKCQISDCSIHAAAQIVFPFVAMRQMVQDYLRAKVFD